MSEEAFDGDYLFDVEQFRVQASLSLETPVATGEVPVWTDNKARFIMLYLHYFVLLTKHGTYIDGFAGPQEECENDGWAAKLVLDSDPKWIKHFYLCDLDKAQFARLKDLCSRQPLYDSKNRKLNRKITLYHADFNAAIDEILGAGKISPKQATFCLLDQRTFQCHWKTVEKIARYKKTGNKIELFYFLAIGWLERSFAAQKNLEVLAMWWGRDDWNELKAMTREEVRDALVRRLKEELGYKSARAWPIFERQDGGATMYYMIHATDHPEGPKFMSRAYRKVVHPNEPIEQLRFELLGESKPPKSQVSPPPDSQRSA